MAGAVQTKFKGTLIVEHYGDVASEHAAARETAAVTRMTHYRTLMLTGADSNSFLAGLSTNRVTELKPGQGNCQFMLNLKAKVEAEIRVLVGTKETHILTDSQGLEWTEASLKKYLFNEDMEFQNRSAQCRILKLVGPQTPQILERLSKTSIVDMSPLDHVVCELAGSETTVIFDPLGQLPGTELLVSAKAEEGILAAIADAGARPIGIAALNILRLEEKQRWFGIDYDNSNLPAETNLLDQSVSFTKGCYLGQEIVARMQTYGQARKQSVPIECHAASQIDPGSELLHQGKKVGTVTSIAARPGGGAVGFAMIRSEATEPGTHLQTQDSIELIVVET